MSYLSSFQSLPPLPSPGHKIFLLSPGQADMTRAFPVPFLGCPTVCPSLRHLQLPAASLSHRSLGLRSSPTSSFPVFCVHQFVTHILSHFCVYSTILGLYLFCSLSWIIHILRFAALQPLPFAVWALQALTRLLQHCLLPQSGHTDSKLC